MDLLLEHLLYHGNKLLAICSLQLWWVFRAWTWECTKTASKDDCLCVASLNKGSHECCGQRIQKHSQNAFDLFSSLTTLRFFSFPLLGCCDSRTHKTHAKLCPISVWFRVIARKIRVWLSVWKDNGEVYEVVARLRRLIRLSEHLHACDFECRPRTGGGSRQESVWNRRQGVQSINLHQPLPDALSPAQVWILWCRLDTCMQATCVLMTATGSDPTPSRLLNNVRFFPYCLPNLIPRRSLICSCIASLTRETPLHVLRVTSRRGPSRHPWQAPVWIFDDWSSWNLKVKLGMLPKEAAGMYSPLIFTAHQAPAPPIFQSHRRHPDIEKPHKDIAH